MKKLVSVIAVAVALGGLVATSVAPTVSSARASVNGKGGSYVPGI